MRELAVLCLVAAACDGAAEGVPDAECAISADCDFGSFCDAGVCAQGCRENGDCGHSVPCIGGICDDSSGACNGDFYCEYGEACDSTTHRCYPAAGARLCETCTFRWCLGDEDCPAGVDCVGYVAGESAGQCASCGEGFCGEILQPPGSCTDDADCAPGAYCRWVPCFDDATCRDYDAGTCSRRYDPGGGLAAVNFDGCSIGECVTGECAFRGCEDDHDCGRGFACFSVFGATEPVHTPCETDDDCPGGRSCVLPNEAGERVCGCEDDADCTSGTCTLRLCLSSTLCSPAVGFSCEDMQ